MSLPDRIELIRQSDTVTGIDFVQVSENQLELFVFLHHLDLPAPLLASLSSITADDVEITALSKIEPESVPVIQHITPIPAVDNRPALHLIVEQPGGFGFYQLSIHHTSLDSYFNHIAFSFKASCPTEFDCRYQEDECPVPESNDFPVDYRARDFWSYRKVLTDFASQRYPDWQDRLEADQGMMLVELFSALGDEFSYAQDRIQRETNFTDATQRRSLKHFAQLMDYTIDNGAAAQSWIDVTVNADGVLDAGTPVTDLFNQTVFEIGQGLSDLGKSFALSINRNVFTPYIWDENDTCLFAGSFSLTLSGHHGLDFLPDADIDPVGKWVLLATVPTTPDIPQRRLFVRVVQAIEASDPVTGDLITEIEWDQPIPFDLDLETLTVRGNILPATAGETVPPIDENAIRFRIGPAADPMDPDAELPQAIERAGSNTNFSQTFDPDARVKFLFSLPETANLPLTWLDKSQLSYPEISLQQEPGDDWFWLPTLIGEEVAMPTQPVFTLEHGSYRPVFTSETLDKKFKFSDYSRNDGMTIRFGDGEFGLAPQDGDVFALRYRVSNGANTNVTRDTLIRFKTEFSDPPTRPAFVDSITNPVAASGGRDAESEEQIKINVPQAYQAITYRAVKPEDYVEISERLDWVQKAGATFRWTGSWPTVFVTPDPFDSVGLLSEQRTELKNTLDRVRMVSRDVCVKDPVYANIDLEIKICVRSDAYRGQVKAAVLKQLFGDVSQSGFFDPDNFTFGTPLSRSQLAANIQDVPGVHAVNGMRIRRRGWFDWRPFAEFNFSVGINELISVTNNALLPERGSVRLIMESGA